MYSKFIILCCVYFFSIPLWAEEKQSLISFPTESDIDAVFLHQSQSIVKKTIGRNHGAIFNLEDGTIIHVKEREKKIIQDYDALSVSFITSKILQSIIPKQVIQVLVVHTSDDIFIGSYDIPNFQKSQRILSYWSIFACHFLKHEYHDGLSLCDFLQSGLPPEQQKNRKLLDLVLDLTDIWDRHDLNMGTRFIDNQNLAVTVDIDRTYLGIMDWFTDKDYTFFLDPKIQDALEVLSYISDEDFDEICDNALKDYERSLYYRFEHVESQKILSEEDKEALFKNLDTLIKNAKFRKRQMRWAYDHLRDMKTESEKWFFSNSFLEFLIVNKAPINKVQIKKLIRTHISSSYCN